jgi:nicotinate-nucleotide pyrophosphorylase (carboxylating)
VAEGEIVSKGKGIVAGLPVAALCFRRLDSRVGFEQQIEDGERVSKNLVLARLHGPAASILKAERVALNFLQRLSGIASLTGRFVDAVKDCPVKILDTRKTTPGLRMLEKYAVDVAGGSNHRFGLNDGILIKDNHLMFWRGGASAPSDSGRTGKGAITEAVAAARASAGHLMKIEVETETLAQVREAVRAGADAILLDNMTIEILAEAVAIVRRSKKKIFLEASGNVSLRTIRGIAATGVDGISIGALTHSPPALDISLDLRAGQTE